MATTKFKTSGAQQIGSFFGNVGRFINPQTTPYGQGKHTSALMSRVVSPAYASPQPAPAPQATPQPINSTSAPGGIFDQFGRQIGSSAGRTTTNVNYSSKLPNTSLPGSGGVNPPGDGGLTTDTATDTGGGDANLFETAQQAPSIDFDAIIAPALNALSQSETAAQGLFEADVSEIEQGGQGRRATAEAQLRSQTGGLEQRGRKTTSIAESAIGEARRGFSEIQQGLLARYGTGVSTGLGAAGIVGGKTIQAIGQIRAQLSESLNEIETAKTSVVETTNAAIREAEANTQVLKQRSRAELQQNLAQIGQLRGEIQSRKQELAYNAMELYRQSVADVNQRNTKFKQDIYLQAQKADQALKLAGVRAQQRISELNQPQYKILNPGQNLIQTNAEGGPRQVYGAPGGITNPFDSDNLTNIDTSTFQTGSTGDNVPYNLIQGQ